MTSRAVELADRALERLEKVAREGLPEAYRGDPEGFWFDWYPDLPWDPEGLQEAMRHLTQNRGERLAEIEGALLAVVGGEPIREQLQVNLSETAEFLEA